MAFSHMKWLYDAHVLLLLLSAVINVWVWRQNRFWFPRYIHWLAVVAFLLGWVTAYVLSTLGTHWVDLLWVPFLFSGVVYVTSLVYGGAVILEHGKIPSDGQATDNASLKNMLKSFTIQDDLTNQDTGAIEVILDLQNGEQRWCYFMTPQALAVCGDWIEGTQTRFHFDVPYMIVVAARLDERIIGQALQDIDNQGRLEQCSLALSSS